MDDADSVVAYMLFVCCFAWNLDELATEAEKAQPVLSNIIGAMCLYMCLAEQHQMVFDMVLSQGLAAYCRLSEIIYFILDLHTYL